MPPSPQQTTAAANIERAFGAGIRYALLMAKCQSGKTGAYHALIRRLLAAGTIQRVYIVCGSAETILRDQALGDALEKNPEHVAAGRINIIFHQDFKSSSMDLTNALVVVDETHLVQSKGQQLHTFLGRHGITLDGNPTNLRAKNTYVVSVDATPYAELAALAHKKTPYEKHVEQLQPGDGYVGLSDFYILSTLLPTYDITSATGRATFTALLERQGPKYALMRLSNSNKGGNASEAVVRAICAAKGYSVLDYTSEKMGVKAEIAITRKEQEDAAVAIPCLEDAPARTTVVIIRGRLRAGKVVPKPHIGFVWEGAKNSKTDTIVQGLAGRMCGYHTNTPLIFVPPPSLVELSGKVVKHSEIGRAIYEPAGATLLPRHATNLKKGAVAAAPADGKTACAPLRIEWDGRQIEDLEPGPGLRRHMNEEALALLRRRGLPLLDASDRYTAAQKAEIRAAAMASPPRPPLHGRHYNGSSSDGCTSYYKQVLEGYASGTAPAELIDGCPIMTFVIVDSAFARKLPGASHRHLYVIFYTRAAGLKDLTDRHLLSRIPTTTDKCVFSHDLSTFDRAVAAAGAVGIALEDIKTPEKLEARLRDYLTLWRTSALVVSRSIVAPDAGCFKLSKTHYHYTSDKENDVKRMCARLETDFGLKKKQLEVKFARSGAHTFNLKSISW
jgi:hypothetical protein